MNDTQRIILATLIFSVVLLIVMGALTLIVINEINGMTQDHATIAGTQVPTVHGQEDEVIWWMGPDTLGCVHFERVR